MSRLGQQLVGPANGHVSRQVYVLHDVVREFVTSGCWDEENSCGSGQRGDLSGLDIQFRALSRDSADLLGKLRTRSFQCLAYDSRGSAVVNSADVGNG